MKKVFTYLGWFIIIAVVIAAFTAPSKEDCRTYALKNIADTTAVKPSVTESPFKLLGAKIFSFYTVTYFKPTVTTRIKLAGDTSKITIAIPAKASDGSSTNTYIGAYHSFYKW